MEDPDHLISVSEEPKKNSTPVITLVRLFAGGHGSVARLILYKLKIRHGIWLVAAEPSDCGIIALRRLSGRGASLVVSDSYAVLFCRSHGYL